MCSLKGVYTFFLTSKSYCVSYFTFLFQEELCLISHTILFYEKYDLQTGVSD